MFTFVDMDPQYSVILQDENEEGYNKKSGGMNIMVLAIVVPIVVAAIVGLGLLIAFYPRYNFYLTLFIY